MAEAHSAIAFNFTVTPDGDFDVNFNWVLLEAFWHHILHSLYRRVIKFRNALHNGIYPLKPFQWFTFVLFVLSASLFGFDFSHGFVEYVETSRPVRLLFSPFTRHIVAAVLFATIVWGLTSIIIRQLFKWLLSYKGWMNDEFGRVSLVNKIYLKLVQFISQRSPLLFSLQGSLPNLPVPKLDDTVKRYLESVEPLHTEEEMAEIRKLAEEFRNGIGPKLQRYVWLKWLTSTNYVSDWWEQYVYLKGRSPIMVNSNYYGIDMMFVRPTTIQAARAANATYFALKWRSLLDREQVKPIYTSNCIPLCSYQYERQFNSTRIPGEEIDILVHHEDSRHIVVFHRGRFFKIVVYSGGRLLQPNELERIFQTIIDDPSPPAEGEMHLAALTAGSRTPWAIARKFYFSEGMNRQSLRDIEHAAFFVALDDDEYWYDKDDHTKLDRWARAMLHGRCYDRWFDKSFNFIVAKNATLGFNAEHTWADAPIMGHMWEYVLAHDCQIIKYDPDGHCVGLEKTQMVIRPPIRLQWNLVHACQEVITQSLQEAEAIAQDVDLHLVPHLVFGKGAMKKCKISPDAFIQAALQIAQFRDQGRFCLTYESSMTRMYREGRTETVRSCTKECCEFVRAMEDSSKSNEERIELLKKSTRRHQDLYKAAMAGAGIDRHLFTLYIVGRWLGLECPFLKKAISEPWRLSTSQTPSMQTDYIDFKNTNLFTGGGGFGPVADDGYGVSYVINGESMIMFHVSSKRSCPTTNSKRMGDQISKALADILELFQGGKKN